MASLDDAARTDPLTGLLNRRAFEELFEHELERVHRTGGRVSVLIGDLDGFKAVNDRFGHEAGDAVLAKVADDMLKWKRKIDTPARIGGEEFAVLLPDTDERGAYLVAERLRRATHRSFAEYPLPVTISFGVATQPEHGDDLRSLLRAADRALYAAKDLGKDRTAIFSAEVARVLARASGSQSGDLHLAPLMALAEALDVRDHGNAAHSRTVGLYSRMMAVELGLSPERVERVRAAGVLHDVGKIGVSDPLLVKIGPLGDEDWKELRTHPEIGAQLLSRPELADLRGWVLAHHEWLDGSRVPVRPGRGRHSARGEDPRRGGLVRGHDPQPGLPAGPRRGGGARGAARRLRDRSSTETSWTRSSQRSIASAKRSSRSPRQLSQSSHKVPGCCTVRAPTEEPRYPPGSPREGSPSEHLLATHVLKTSHAPLSLRAVRLVDVLVLVLALPVFVAAGWPLFAWAGVTAVWLFQRGIQALIQRRARASHQPAHLHGPHDREPHGTHLVPHARGAGHRPDRP